MNEVGALVVGAGVVGLACALELARGGHEVLVLEAEPTFGSGTSSRNSEVIHAGLYYPEGSLKARLCVHGRHLLYAFCEERGVPHRRLGKLVFAAGQAELPILDRIAAHAAAAGVDDLRRLSGPEAGALEPALASVGALLSPSTGIVDSHALMLAMLGEIEARGGSLVCNAAVTRAVPDRGAWAVCVADDPEPVVHARTIVNAAGLAAQAVAGLIEGLDAALVPPLLLSRGCYFTYSGPVPFSRLIYPVPVPGGLGTHLTLDMAGRARFGPNVQPVDAVDYTVDPAQHPEFVAAARRIWPALDPSRLQPGYAGIRSKIGGPGGGDFVISGPGHHGLPGLVNLFGVESPGLTASLAIGEEVAALVAMSV